MNPEPERPQIRWFVDDSKAYRVTTHKKKPINGAKAYRVTTQKKPINGAIFIFNAVTGQLFLKVIHASVWAGHNHQQDQHLLSQLAQRKSAEEIVDLIRSLPVEQQPNQIMDTTRREGVHLLADFPEILIKKSQAQLPLRALLKIGKFRDLVSKATKSQLVLLNIYDEWLRTDSSYLAFSRLLLIIRALDVKKKAAKMFLYRYHKKPEQIWPCLNNNKWWFVETKMRKLILLDYGRKNKVDTSDLTSTEIRHIILGLLPSDH